jgi:hypothetical protein
VFTANTMAILARRWIGGNALRTLEVGVLVADVDVLDACAATTRPHPRATSIADRASRRSA